MEQQPVYNDIPVIDISAFTSSSDAEGTGSLHSDHETTTAQKQEVAKSIGRACEEVGFFYVKGHGINETLLNSLFEEGREFFARPVDYKETISMQNSNVFRGYFKLGDELTNKKPDWKEGLYFERELSGDHPDVKSGIPMHGRNQFPPHEDFPEFRDTILNYMTALTELGHRIMQGVSLSLGLRENFFRERFTEEPFTPFRLFHYPAQKGCDPHDQPWGVGEHTDYGVLTILATDDDGLEVRLRDGKWVSAPYIPGTFIVNIGDALDIWTNGKYKATPHRVRNTTTRNRLSAPFFFDPNFRCIVAPLLDLEAPGNSTTSPKGVTQAPRTKWDDLANEKYSPSQAQAAVNSYRAGNEAIKIRYGDYILNKVLTVFPQLSATALQEW